MNRGLESIKGVGPKRVQLFKRLGIESVEDLLLYFPKQYEDRREVVKICKLREGMQAVVHGRIVSIKEKMPRPRLRLLNVNITDGTGYMSVVFFNQSYRKTQLREDQEVSVYGRVEKAYRYEGFQMNSPEIEPIHSQEGDGAILPVYGLTEGVNQRMLREAVGNWFAANDKLPSSFSEYCVHTHLGVGQEAMSRYEAMKEIHFPSTPERFKEARRQLAYEELFVMQAGVLLLRSREQSVPAIPMTAEDNLISQMVKALPFSLTGDQRRAWAEISADMEQDKPMQRMVQGDVGSGKTVIAIMALLKAVDNGLQGALMAPTEILARQHYEGVCDLLQDLPVRVCLLTGSTRGKEKAAIYEDLAAGHIDIVIGTHALVQEAVSFKKLGLVVIDEQHRFGVNQRAKLQEKGMGPHVLVMTATPIPRTLSLTMYGDLELSFIKEMPPGRKPVDTYVVNSSKEASMLEFFSKEMAAGHQIYVVCPLVEESEKMDLFSAESTFNQLLDYFYPRFTVAMVHGRMKTQEKEAIMEGFHRGDYQLLVSTTVIEVGVNVPNATIMCVRDAERFGLSQLHQLRGRVGRGSAKSYCILMSDAKQPGARERLKIMEETSDGFALAEFDLRQRGAGQFFGVSQHGMSDLKIADIIGDLDLLVAARKEAMNILRTKGVDYVLEELKTELDKRFGNDFLRILYS